MTEGRLERARGLVDNRATVVGLFLFVLLSAGCGGADNDDATVTTQGFVIHDCLHCAK